MHILASKAVLDQVRVSGVPQLIWVSMALLQGTLRLHDAVWWRFYTAAPQLLTESMHKDHELQDKLLLQIFQYHTQQWLLVQLLLKATLSADCPIDMQDLV